MAIGAAAIGRDTAVPDMATAVAERDEARDGRHERPEGPNTHVVSNPDAALNVARR
jgi:hypothetical protein